MITLVQFVWLIHYALLALYGWEIAVFAYNRSRQPAAFKQIGSLQAHWNAMGSGALGLIAGHTLFYGLYVKAVPIILIIYGGVALYCAMQNEAVKPFLRKTNGAPKAVGRASVVRDRLISVGCAAAVLFFMISQGYSSKDPPILGYVLMTLGTYFGVDYFLRGRRAKAAAKTAEDQRASNNAKAEDDDDLGFKRDRWEKASSWSDAGSTAGYNAEADYQNALTEAQKWADQASSRENAVRWASKFEKLADNPALHPKDKLRYRLAAMLLRERLKGQGKAQASKAGAEPSDADLSQLGLPVPRK
jgi:hypothetical protein